MQPAMQPAMQPVMRQPLQPYAQTLRQPRPKRRDSGQGLGAPMPATAAVPTAPKRRPVPKTGATAPPAPKGQKRPAAMTPYDGNRVARLKANNEVLASRRRVRVKRCPTRGTPLEPITEEVMPVPTLAAVPQLAAPPLAAPPLAAPSHPPSGRKALGELPGNPNAMNKKPKLELPVEKAGAPNKKPKLE